MGRAHNGVIAVVLGCAAAVVLFVPFVAVSYRRRGGMTLGRSATWLALLIYAFAIVAYTLLPIPHGSYRCMGYWLDPVNALDQIHKYHGYSTLANPAVQELVLNVMLFVPFGVILRALTGRGVVVATVLGFTVSMAVELTQRTGVWHLFPCAYRLFDTSDLITNTAGAFGGSALSWIVFRHHRPDAHRLAPARTITVAHRLVGMVCDALIAAGIAAAVVATITLKRFVLDDATRHEVVRLARATSDRGVLVAFVVMGLVTILSGSTPGEHTVLIEGVDGRRPALLWRAVRYALGVGGGLVILLADAIPDWTLVPYLVVGAILTPVVSGMRGRPRATAAWSRQSSGRAVR